MRDAIGFVASIVRLRITNWLGVLDFAKAAQPMRTPWKTLASIDGMLHPRMSKKKMADMKNGSLAIKMRDNHLIQIDW